MFPASTERKELIPALVGVAVCLFLPKGGVLGFFFLVPLGFVAYRYGYRVAWGALFLGLVGNVVVVIGTVLARGFPPEQIFWDILYFTVMTSLFTVITAPPPALSHKYSAPARFMAASCVGALLFTVMFLRAMSSPGMTEYLASLLNSLVSGYQSSGADVVQSALMESMTPESVVDFMKTIMLRGGSLVSAVMMLYACRQISYALVFIILRSQGKAPERANSLSSYHVNPLMIWVLSLSLLLVVLTRMIKLEIPEILLWNILILCCIMYFAQGMGILQFFLARPTVLPFLRPLLSMLFIFLIFSPGVNVVILAGVALLGITENWVPFRARKTNGPPSTPEAGDGNA